MKLTRSEELANDVLYGDAEQVGYQMKWPLVHKVGTRIEEAIRKAVAEERAACARELEAERDRLLLQNGELKEALAQAAVAMETAECHGQHEDCTRCERIRWLRSKTENRKSGCQKCGDETCTCAIRRVGGLDCSVTGDISDATGGR